MRALPGDPCRKCGATERYAVKHADGNISYRCVPCRRAYNAEYSQENKARRTPENPERAKARVLKWQRDNPERIRVRTLKWQHANPERRRAITAKSHRAHPETSLAAGTRRRARELSAPGRGVTAAQWKETLAAALGICAYCNERRPLALDHIEPLSRGGAHDTDNITTACKSCNSSKHDTPLLLWLARRAIARAA